jgi:hypothetical protein
MSFILIFSVQPFKRQFSAAAGTVFNVNFHCGTLFLLLDKKQCSVNETVLSCLTIKG